MSAPSKETQGSDDDKTNDVSVQKSEDVATPGNELKPDQADDVEASQETKDSEEKVEVDKEEGVETESQDKTDDANSAKDVDTDLNVDSDSQDADNFKNTLSDNYSDYDAYYEQAEEYLDSGSEKELYALSNDMGLSSSKDDSYSTKKYQDTKKEKERKTKPFSFGKRWSERDTEAYRTGYPGKKDNMNDKMNLDFYSNKMRSRPDGDYIDNIHMDWYGDYHRLEAHHGYIQWLFPIRENGMNFHAQELQLHEAKAIRENQKAKKRVLRSYELMLDFYGIKLKDKETGELERAENWKERFAHLNRSMHNYLRITRILKSLGELGYEHLKAPFVRFILVEALKKRTLDKTVQSCYNYWLETIRDDEERAQLQEFADELLTS